MTVMAAADHGGPGPDHYQLLGVPRERLAGGDRAGLAAPGPGRAPRLPAGRGREGGGPVPRPGRGLAGARRPGPPRRLRPGPGPRQAAAVTPAARSPCRSRLARPGGHGRRGRCRGRRCGQARSGWTAALPAQQPAAGDERGRSGWPRWPQPGRCGTWPGTGTGRGEPGVGGPGPGPVQHLGGRRAGRAAPADAADLRAGGAAGPGPQRGRHPPVLPPGHRPAGRDLRADRRRAEPGRHPPGPAAAGGDPPAAGRAGPAAGPEPARQPAARAGPRPAAARRGSGAQARVRLSGRAWPPSRWCRRAVRARSAARSSSRARIRSAAARVWPWSNSSLIRAAKASWRRL